MSDASGDYRFKVQIYYEDTDHSGVVYHANYLKYFERAREAVIGAERLVDLWYGEGLGFAVYKADLTYHKGARFGEILTIRSRFAKDGRYRIVWNQSAWQENSGKPSVEAVIHLVCVDREKKLRPLPDMEISCDHLHGK